MKILLDECLPLDFRRSFPTHDTHAAQWAGLKGKKNGELLQAAEIADYDVLPTVG
jgi:predicted nuclease of predicted toxin-antitoxin system